MPHKGKFRQIRSIKRE